MVSVAIDGPACAGKSTLARRLAAELGYIYVDTGAMYRAIGLYALRAGKDPKDNAAVDALLPQIELRLASIAGEQHIYLKDEDVSTAIRTEAAGMAASAVGANPAVRAFLLELQRSMAKKQDVLMDGRDIGTVVLPDATVKIFLTASPEARATRRWKEYQAKGIDTPYEEVLADVKQRDYQDTHRAAAPLKQAEDAVLLDTSELDFEQSLDAMKQIKNGTILYSGAPCMACVAHRFPHPGGGAGKPEKGADEGLYPCAHPCVSHRPGVHRCHPVGQADGGVCQKGAVRNQRTADMVLPLLRRFVRPRHQGRDGGHLPDGGGL